MAIMWTVYATLAARGMHLHGLKLVLNCASFAACSWGMNVLNKALVEEFATPCLVTGAQMLMTVVASLVLARDKLTLTGTLVRNWAFVPLLFFGMLVSSLFTYEYLTLSMLMVIRNLGPIVTIPIEKVVMPAGKKPNVTGTMFAALLIVFVGAVLYGGHVEFSWVGLCFSLLNMFLAIADRVLQRRLLTTECEGLSTESCVLLNNLFGFFPTCVLGLGLGEFMKFDATHWFFSSGTVLLLLSGAIGSGICYFAIAVQREISATSFMVLQNLARILVVFAGVRLFGDPIGNTLQVLGLALSFLGALWYGHAQLSAAKAKAPPAEEDPEKQPLIGKK
eukprot:TRINITY_DN64867_c0_g1_i1.p1 TRINITY_DN64867_c0_g1~~TRINITY_DN64867_c0_g1_i1.p1  ORF type:complete len:394 (+),score=65.43 TRINITY_DN64867_c0_g1_i1:180-1184(+)